ncbi:MAG: DUF971 domain-containing protein [Myxococcaceae bacterium]
MSFWNRIQAHRPPPVATDIERSADGRTLKVSFDDGSTHELPARKLRQHCPCAGCVDEWTRKRTFDPALVKPDMTIRDVQPVGNYAIGIRFADNHTTGIFHWAFLKELAHSTSP